MVDRQSTEYFWYLSSFGSRSHRNGNENTCFMSEKRKRSLKIVAEFCGKVSGKQKRYKVELFRAELFPFRSIPEKRFGSHSYRIRINGKWAAGTTTFTLTQVLTQLRQLINRNAKR